MKNKREKISKEKGEKNILSDITETVDKIIPGFGRFIKKVSDIPMFKEKLKEVGKQIEEKFKTNKTK